MFDASVLSRGMAAIWLGMIESIGIAQSTECHVDLILDKVLFLDRFSRFSSVRTYSGMARIRCWIMIPFRFTRRLSWEYTWSSTDCTYLTFRISLQLTC